MGDVYLAYDLRLGNQQVVVKENRGGDPQLFYAEATILAMLRHPGLPRVIDHFVDPPPPTGTGAQYLVMDYVAGQNLEQSVQTRGALPEREVLAWLNQILDAVQYLHANRVIHRDIKPQNIIVTPSGRAMLVDFGIAKVMSPGQPTISAAHGVGSPNYAPLEQYTGGTNERSDIYALGATFYFALTGNEPPPAPDRANGAPLLPIRSRNPGISPNTEQVIATAAAVMMAQRYSTAETMWRALHGQAPVVATAFPTSSVSASFGTPAASALQRLPKRVWLAVGVAATLFIGLMSLNLFVAFRTPTLTPTLAVGLVATPTRVPTETPAPTHAPTQTPTWTPTATPRLPVLEGTPIPLPLAAISRANVDRITQLARCGKGKIGQVAWSPDGRQIAVASSLGIYFYNTQTWQQAQFSEPGAWVSSMAFSPDGKTLASGALDATTKLWDVASGQELRAFSGHTNSVTSVAFSPDGKTLTAGSYDNTIKLWDGASGQELRTFSGHTSSVMSVAFSPDGKTLASGANDYTIKLWDVASGQELHTLNWYMGLVGLVNSVVFSPDGKTLASGSTDTTIQLWDVASGQLLRTFSGHTNPVLSVAFSPDGTTLASASDDKTIKLWDVASGQELRTLSGHTNTVMSVAFSPDGKLLASGSQDGTVRLWGVR